MPLGTQLDDRVHEEFQEISTRLGMAQPFSLTERQLECLSALMLGDNVFAVLPTGSGKLLLFIFPGLLRTMSNRLTVVIVPTVSLIDDQVSGVNSRWGANICVSADEKVSDSMLMEDSVRFLFCTPESFIHSVKIREYIHRTYQLGRIARFVIDEAHCLSLWGERFRPDFIHMSDLLLSQYADAQRLALTATATIGMQEEIISSLNLRDSKRNLTVVVESPYRDNVFLVVRKRPARSVEFYEQLAADIMASALKGDTNTIAGVVVYCLTVRQCREIAEYFNEVHEHNNFKAAYYHSRMAQEERRAIHMSWLQGTSVNIICATCSFSMGINNPRSTLIIHTGLPTSMEEYVQQMGRVGRKRRNGSGASVASTAESDLDDRCYAVAVLYFRWSDISLVEQVINQRSTEELEADQLCGQLDAVIARQMARSRHVLVFADTRHECRWESILKYFGFSDRMVVDGTLKCNHCDNCKEPGGIFLRNTDLDLTNQMCTEDYEHEVTDVAKAILQGVNKINSVDNRRLNVTDTVKVLLGLKHKSVYNGMTTVGWLKTRMVQFGNFRCTALRCRSIIQECIKQNLLMYNVEKFAISSSLQHRATSASRRPDHSNRARYYIIVSPLGNDFIYGHDRRQIKIVERRVRTLSRSIHTTRLEIELPVQPQTGIPLPELRYSPPFQEECDTYLSDHESDVSDSSLSQYTGFESSASSDGVVSTSDRIDDNLSVLPSVESITRASSVKTSNNGAGGESSDDSQDYEDMVDDFASDSADLSDDSDTVFSFCNVLNPFEMTLSND